METNTTLEHRDNSALEKAEGTHSGPYFEPAVDILETDEGLTIIADMPGVSEKNVEIDLREGVLTLLGTYHAEQTPGQCTIAEFARGNYLRRFTMTDKIDQERISASMSNGVLTVMLPKSASAKPRKIKVRTN